MSDENVLQKKICFIVHGDKFKFYNECMCFLDELILPPRMVKDIMWIGKNDLYADKLQEDDVAIWVYLSEHTWITNRSFICDVVEAFEKNQSIGIIGVAGWNTLKTENSMVHDYIGNVSWYNGDVYSNMYLKDRSGNNVLEEVKYLSDQLVVIRPDVCQNVEDIRKKDGVLSTDIIEKDGYRAGILIQNKPTCYLNSGVYEENNDQLDSIGDGLIDLFNKKSWHELKELTQDIRELKLQHRVVNEISNLMEMYWVEEKSIYQHSCFFSMKDWDEASALYGWVRFVLTRFYQGIEDERTDKLQKMFYDNEISKDAIRIISGTLPEREFGNDFWKIELKEKPFVTLQMVTHNSGQLLRDSIECILKQTYENFEFIIIDDASTDDTRDIILSYKDPRIKTIFLEKNRHVCVASNIGLKQGVGKYLIQLGHDDLCRADRVEKQVEFMEEHPQCSVCFSWVNVVNEKNEIVNNRSTSYKKFREVNYEPEKIAHFLFLKWNILCAVSTCIRKELLNRCGDYRYGLLQLQDYDLWLRMSLQGHFYILQESLSSYRWYDEPGKNLSYMNRDAMNRNSHECEWIGYDFIKNLTDEQFLNIFKNELRYKNSKTPVEIRCEKAFLLSKTQNCHSIMWFIELLEDEECRNVLEDKYNFSVLDFYELNAQPLAFDSTYVDKTKYLLQCLSEYESSETINERRE